MTKCACSIIAVPLGPVSSRILRDGSHAHTFRVSLVTSLEVLEPYSEQDLCHMVDAHPLWHTDNLEYVFARISGRQPSAPDQVVTLEPEFEKRDADAFRLRLKIYLLGRLPLTAQLGQKQPHLASHDSRFDRLPASAFFDSQKVYEESIPARDLAAYAMSLGLAIKSSTKKHFEAGRVSPKLMRLANAMVMQDYLLELYPKGNIGGSRDRLSTLLHELIGAEPGAQLSGQSPSELRRELQRHADRIHGYEAQPTILADDSAIDERELKALLDAREPNNLLRIAARDPILSAQFGLTTCWKLTLPSVSRTVSTFVRDLSLHIERWPDTHGLKVDFDMTPTAFITDTHVYPAPRNPLGGRTSGFAWLNDRQNDQNYRVLQVNSDQEILKAWVLQDANSLRTHAKAQAPSANIKEPTFRTGSTLEQASSFNSDQRVKDEHAKIVDDRPALLRGQQTGVNQPDCQGVTFSASTLDLADAGAAYGVDARQSENRYYLEDLWVGYRIDVARVYDGAGQGAFFSLNSQLADVQVVNTELVFLHQEAESYYDREQLCLDRPTGVEITTWTGIAESQQFPFVGEEVNRELPNNTPSGCDYENTQDLEPSELVHWQHKPLVGKLPRLRYGWTYRYRIRNVFSGGVSLSMDDADVILNGTEATKLRALHTQDFEFRRVEAFSPGELANPNARTSENRASHDSEQKIFLLENSTEKAIYVLPRPIGLTEMRFGGIIGNAPDEAIQLRGFAETKNVRRLLFGADGKLKNKRYFLDGDVNAILVRVDIRSRNEECAHEDLCGSIPGNEVIDGIECTSVEPWNIATRRLEFGRAGNWTSFKPIRLTFRTTSNPDTTARLRGFSASNELVLSVAPGDHVELLLLPDVTEEQIKGSYFYGNAVRHAIRQASRGFIEATFNGRPVPTLPIIAERTIEVIHTTRRPLKAPTLEFDQRYQVRESAKGHSVFRLRRSTTNSDAYFVGSIGVHAPSTGTVRLEAKWKVVDDEMDPNRPILIEGFTRSEARSVHYAPSDPLTGEEGFKIFSGPGPIDEKAKRIRTILEQQCLENTVHMPLPPVTNELGATQVCNALNFQDLGRRIGTLTAHATPRYRDLYPNTAEDRVSEPITIEVPSRQMPSIPEVAMVLPTFADSNSDQPGRIGLRLYLKRPWFETGVGERCAIGCIFRETDDAIAYAIAKKYATHWGEDVFERPRLAQTLRIPRASDFGAPTGATGGELDATLYPAFDPRERGPVLYEDGVPLAVEIDATETIGATGSESAIKKVNAISLASYALRFDQNESAYFFDVIVRGGFFGWLKLALYRHQPCSVDGFALSPVPTNAYAAVLQGDVLTKVDEGGWTLFRIGPIFDRTVSFVASDAARQGDGVYVPHGPSLHFSEQIIANERHFVLRVSKNKSARLVIYKTRAGIRQWAFTG